MSVARAHLLALVAVTVAYRRAALIALLVAVALCLTCFSVACYPDPLPPQPPPCVEEGITVIAAADGGECSTARFWILRTFVEQRAQPAAGVDLERARGYTLRIHPGSDGGTFRSRFWNIDLAGQTDPRNRLIEVASFTRAIPHELNHAGDEEGCLDLPDGGAACHQRWEERGVCDNIRATGQYEECGQP